MAIEIGNARWARRPTRRPARPAPPRWRRRPTRAGRTRRSAARATSGAASRPSGPTPSGGRPGTRFRRGTAADANALGGRRRGGSRAQDDRLDRRVREDPGELLRRERLAAGATIRSKRSTSQSRRSACVSDRPFSIRASTGTPWRKRGVLDRLEQRERDARPAPSAPSPRGTGAARRAGRPRRAPPPRARAIRIAAVEHGRVERARERHENAPAAGVAGRGVAVAARRPLPRRAPPPGRPL